MPSISHGRQATAPVLRRLPEHHVPEPVRGDLANRATLMQLEQQRPCRHVFELANSVAPIPTGSQLHRQTPTAPARMPAHPVAELLQPGSVQPAALHDQALVHALGLNE